MIVGGCQDSIREIGIKRYQKVRKLRDLIKAHAQGWKNIFLSETAEYFQKISGTFN